MRLRSVAVALLIGTLAPVVPAQMPPTTTVVPVPAFDLQGHRGIRGLRPENTLPGFAHALTLGVTTLETDIAITRDGVLVISHDRSLNGDITRGPDGQFLNGKGPVIVEQSFQELQRYDVGRLRPGSKYATDFSEQQPVDGALIPKLSDLFELVRKSGNDKVRFALETKLAPAAPQETVAPDVFARSLITAIRQAGMQHRTSIISFDWRTLQVVQKEAPEILTVYLTIESQNFNNIGLDPSIASPWTAGFRLNDHGGSLPRMIKAAGGHTWSAFHRNLTAALVKEAQALGLKVLAWTVNSPEQIAKAIDLGVDGVVTDRADLAREEMKRRSIPLPAATPVAP
jgi:glycerophosphoryl diester phosphodiesterase